ncbi:MAG TPA: hypothetical protein DEP99_06450 [Nitrospiraceae bacterium]|nr:hypothetical protein [Nitrospiraceae bacterium]
MRGSSAEEARVFALRLLSKRRGFSTDVINTAFKSFAILSFPDPRSVSRACLFGESRSLFLGVK